MDQNQFLIGIGQITMIYLTYQDVKDKSVMQMIAVKITTWWIYANYVSS